MKGNEDRWHFFEKAERDGIATRFRSCSNESTRQDVYIPSLPFQRNPVFTCVDEYLNRYNSRVNMARTTWKSRAKFLAAATVSRAYESCLPVPRASVSTYLRNIQGRTRTIQPCTTHKKKFRELLSKKKESKGIHARVCRKQTWHSI